MSGPCASDSMYSNVTCSTSDGPFALNHRPHEVREISIGRHLLENRAKLRLGRVRARDFQSAELPLLVHHVNGTPVGDILNDQPSHGSPASARIRAKQTAPR